MIKLVALAVAEIPGLDMEALECAPADADRMYAALMRVCKQEFDSGASYVALNPSAVQARELLLLAAASTASDDLLVVYISSHGVLRSSTLFIPFNDARSNGYGFLDSGEIGAALRRCRGHALLIADCCFSAAALTEAHLRDVYDAPKLSVIASALSYARATHGPAGSDFTLALVRAMDRLSGDGISLTISRIVEYIKEDTQYGGDVLVNLADGQSDLQIADAPNLYLAVAQSGDFSNRFLRRVAESSALMREMLWYSLDDMPDGLKLEIFRSSGDHMSLCEPSWLVRRAIGTIVSRIDDVQPAKVPILLKLLSSRNWMHTCIGLVGSRNLVDDQNIAARLRSLLRVQGKAPMDVTWLAHLYLSDHTKNDLMMALASPLGHTPWGVVDLWKRYGTHSSNQEGMLRIFRESLHERPGDLRDLRVHLDCVGVAEAEILGVPSDPELVENELVCFQYQRQPRGVLGQTPVKWLVSSLYGSWRDQLSGNLRDYLENADNRQIVYDLSVCQRIPSVEHRVSLCQDLAATALDDTHIVGAAKWAVTDPHPWVRRESLKLFPGSRNVAERAIGVTTDRILYPGFLDLLLEAHRNKADVQPQMHGLTKGERSAVEWATAVDTNMV